MKVQIYSPLKTELEQVIPRLSNLRALQTDHDNLKKLDSLIDLGRVYLDFTVEVLSTAAPLNASLSHKARIIKNYCSTMRGVQ